MPWTLDGTALALAHRVVHFDAAPRRSSPVLAAWLPIRLLTLAVVRCERTAVTADPGVIRSRPGR